MAFRGGEGRTWLPVFFVSAVITAAPACVGGARPEEPDRVSPGRWGGDHVALSVSDSAATVEFDCAHGTVNEAMMLDAAGRFDAAGLYVREHAGPVMPGESEDSEPARYTGSADGRSMGLTVVLESGSRVGPFLLVRGEEGRLVKCL